MCNRKNVTEELLVWIRLNNIKKQPHRKPSLSKMKFPLHFCELARFFGKNDIAKLPYGTPL